MFLSVGYTPPPATWPPKTKTSGMGLYLPQNFVTPQRLLNVLQSARIQVPQGWGGGMSGCGCGGTCGGCGDHAHGMGLFESGTDFSGWGWGEWATVGVAALAGVSLLNNVVGAARAVRKTYRRSKSRSARRKRLQEDLSAI